MRSKKTVVPRGRRIGSPSLAARLVLSAERFALPVRQWRRARLGWRPDPHEFADARSVIGPLVAERSVALVGNATSLLEGPPPPVDDHDVVVRINRGPWVAAETGRLGRRTDVLLVSGARMARGALVDLPRLPPPTPQVVFMTAERREQLPESLLRRMSFYPAHWWRELVETIEGTPSTGCMGLHMLSRLGAEVHLYGFDFWHSPTSYDGRRNLGPHDPRAEEAFARSRLPAGRIHLSGEPEGGAGEHT